MLKQGGRYTSHAIVYVLNQRQTVFRLVSENQNEPVTNWLSERNMEKFIADPNNNLKKGE